MLKSLCRYQLLNLVQRVCLCSPTATHSLASYASDSSTSAPEASSSRTAQQSRAASAASTSSNTNSSRSPGDAWSEAEYLQDYDEEQAGEQEKAVDGQQLLRQVLRRTHAAEVRHIKGDRLHS